jgi:hypothetical protein
MKEFSSEWFDASSQAWKQNKKRYGQSWVYTCKEPSCKRRVGLGNDSCKTHSLTHRVPVTGMVLRSKKVKV